MTIYVNHKPYTYLIGWSKLDKWYYGVRYSKRADPNELWVKYFTSSKHVKRFRAKHGDPDILLIRRIFTTAQEAILWEQKVLRRLNVEKNPKFLNAKNDTTKTPSTFPDHTKFKLGNTPWNKGVSFKNTLTLEERKKFGRTFSAQETQYLSTLNKQRFESLEIREIWRQRALDQYSDPYQIEKHRARCISHKDRIWITNGVDNKRIYEYDINLYPGWRRGRFIDQTTVDKMTQSRVKVKE